MKVNGHLSKPHTRGHLTPVGAVSNRTDLDIKIITDFTIIATLCFLVVSLPAFAQGTPRLNSLFPAGGQLGTTVEIAIQGSDLEDAHTLIVEGDPGITAQLHPGGGEVDDTHKPVFEANCGQCHELRSPE